MSQVSDFMGKIEYVNWQVNKRDKPRKEAEAQWETWAADPKGQSMLHRYKGGELQFEIEKKRDYLESMVKDVNKDTVIVWDQFRWNLYRVKSFFQNNKNTWWVI